MRMHPERSPSISGARVSIAATDVISSSRNAFAGKATGTSGKIQRRMKIYADSSAKKSAGFKAREELKSATPQQLSDAHAVKGPRTPERKPPQMTLEQSNAFAKDMKKMGAVKKFNKK